jgi:hypothetical protein
VDRKGVRNCAASRPSLRDPATQRRAMGVPGEGRSGSSMTMTGLGV